jgi:hypothetical protein
LLADQFLILKITFKKFSRLWVKKISFSKNLHFANEAGKGLSNFGSCVNISVFFDAGDKSDADDGFVVSEDWPDVDA